MKNKFDTIFNISMIVYIFVAIGIIILGIRINDNVILFGVCMGVLGIMICFIKYIIVLILSLTDDYKGV